MIMNIFKYISYLSKISLIQTVRANYRLLPRNQAKKFPIIIFKGTQLHIGKNAKLVINCRPKTGLLWIGALDYRWISRGSHNYVSIDGLINISAKVRISYNTKLIVGQNAMLSFGGDNVVNHDSAIMAHENISIGYGSSIGWNVQICDTAFHYVLTDNIVSKKSRRITIGREAWVCSFCNVSRGAYLPDYSILSSCSMLTKDFHEAGTALFIAGIPAKIIKTNTKRIMEFVEPNLCERLDDYFDANNSVDSINITDIQI